MAAARARALAGRARVGRRLPRRPRARRVPQRASTRCTPRATRCTSTCGRAPTKFEAEIVSMTARHARRRRDEDESAASVTSGGTESIMLAMQGATATARAAIERPADGAARRPPTRRSTRRRSCFGIEAVQVPVGRRLPRRRRGRRRTRSTSAPSLVVGSAPCVPARRRSTRSRSSSELARERGVGFHTDACLGGFLLPWAERLGYAVAAVRLPPARRHARCRADTHKFGYAAKGTSVVLYRGDELRHAPVLHVHRLARRALRDADVRGQPPGRR